MQNSTFARNGANKLQLCLEYSDLLFCNPQNIDFLVCNPQNANFLVCNSQTGDLPVFNARNSQVLKHNQDSSI